jgi:hypothetical protein
MTLAYLCAFVVTAWPLLAMHLRLLLASRG